ncbi:hypothetical protein LX36DRAFT_312748 [Colletotrichum falcatum]|nr:hypothetical protein LX36DRAFT_312748 [Colletotrichum falcatum]
MFAALFLSPPPSAGTSPRRRAWEIFLVPQVASACLINASSSGWIEYDSSRLAVYVQGRGFAESGHVGGTNGPRAHEVGRCAADSSAVSTLSVTASGDTTPRVHRTLTVWWHPCWLSSLPLPLLWARGGCGVLLTP